MSEEMKVESVCGIAPKFTGRGMKVVTMCQQANCRSVGLGIVLKDHHQVDCVAVGYNANSPELRGMLYAWADAIVLMQPGMLPYVPPEFHGKTLICDVGPDGYWHARNEQLQAKCHEWVNKWKGMQ